ncbi:hypothetical protein VB779_20505 [Haloarculaceae archaeon H-GB11]|nr:hypothetical protein [Haloarculaceae archaeon H-GB11]
MSPLHGSEGRYRNHATIVRAPTRSSGVPRGDGCGDRSVSPRLVGALLVLLIGWVLGVAVAKVVRKVADRVELDRMVLETPIGRILGEPRLPSRTHSGHSRSGSSMRWRSSPLQTCSRFRCCRSGSRRRSRICRRSSPDC